jgi:hypothetical protein
MSRKIQIVMYYPGRWAYRAKVSLDAHIGDLREVVPDLKVKFVFNGIILNEVMKFRLYGMKDNDLIIVVDDYDSMNYKRRFEAFSKYSETFTENVFNIINPHTSRETARIRDIQLSKLDRKPKSFRRVVKNQLKIMNRDVFRPLEPLNIPEKSLNPSTLPLPCFWSTKNAALWREKSNAGEVEAEISSPKPERTENEDTFIKP